MWYHHTIFSVRFAEYGVISMDNSVAYLFAIIFVVLALNIYFLSSRMRGSSRRKKMNRVAVDEAKQALWRDREIERRIEREQDGANERVKLREETLALYEEVRRRHAEKDRLEGLGFSASGTGELNSVNTDELMDAGVEGAGYESIRLENPELDAYLSGTESDGIDTEEKVEHIGWGSHYLDDSDDDHMDPFDIFKKKKK